MYRWRRSIIRLTLFVQGVLLLTIHFGLMTGLAFNIPASATNYGVYGSILFISFLLEASTKPDRYLEAMQLSTGKLWKVTLRQLFGTFFPLFVFLVYTKDTAVSRAFLLAEAGIVGLMFAWTNKTLPSLINRQLFRMGKHPVSRVLVVCWPGVHQYREALDSLHTARRLGFEFTGYVGEAAHPVMIGGQRLSHLGPVSAATDRQATKGASLVLALGLPKDPGELHLLRRRCEMNGLRLAFVSIEREVVGGQARYDLLGATDVIVTIDEPLLDPVNRANKRVMDLIVSGLAMATIVPIASLVVFVAHLIQSPGPLLYRQKRGGKGEREFEILKFRSLHVANDDETRQVRSSDDRVFPFGRFIRRYSIDELPQFWNVFKGDMSLVGPRPHMREHDRMFAEITEQYPVRHFVKPGMTGLAQIKGWRGEIHNARDLRNRIRWDLVYLQKWSIGLDLWLLWRTIKVVVWPDRTAY